MKRITIKMQDGRERVYATNDSGEGAFVRESYEGAYHQITGNAQTPTFKTAKQFRRWLGKLDGRMIAQTGW